MQIFSFSSTACISFLFHFLVVGRVWIVCLVFYLYKHTDRRMCCVYVCLHVRKQCYLSLNYFSCYCFLVFLIWLFKCLWFFSCSVFRKIHFFLVIGSISRSKVTESGFDWVTVWSFVDHFCRLVVYFNLERVYIM